MTVRRERRHRLGTLTRRGGALTGAGVVAAAAAVVTGQPLLLSASLVPLVLVALALMLDRRRPGHTTATRILVPSVVPVGTTATVRTQVATDSRSALMWEERLPWSLGPRPRLVTTGARTPRARRGPADRLEPIGYDDRSGSPGLPRSVTRVDYQVRPPHRGRFWLGPMEVRRRDPFGLVERRWDTDGRTSLLATPTMVALPPIGLGGATSAIGGQRPRTFAAGSADDVIVREYHRGDDLRRVHWRSTARLGELMVRREEQPWQARATILVDDRAQAHRGTGPGSSFETAVSAAASIAAHLISRGFTVRLVSASRVLLAETTVADPILETLAEIDLTDTAAIDPSVVADQTAVTVAVIGGASGQGLEALHRARSRAGVTLALVAGADGRTDRRTDRSASHSGERARTEDIQPGALPGDLSADLSGDASHSMRTDVPRDAPDDVLGEAAGTVALVRRFGWRASLIGPGDQLESAWVSLRAGHA